MNDHNRQSRVLQHTAEQADALEQSRSGCQHVSCRSGCQHVSMKEFCKLCPNFGH